MKNLDLEQIADDIADEVVISYTKDNVLTPEEAFQLNQLIFRKALSILTEVNKPLGKVIDSSKKSLESQQLSLQSKKFWRKLMNLLS